MYRNTTEFCERDGKKCRVLEWFVGHDDSRRHANSDTNLRNSKVTYNSDRLR